MGGVYDQELATRYIGLGARFVLGANDHALLLNAATQRAELLRGIVTTQGATRRSGVVPIQAGGACRQADIGAIALAARLHPTLA